MARWVKLALAIVCAAACGSALADPVSLIATAIVMIGGYTGIQAFAIIAVGALLSTSQARRKQRKAAAAARADYNAGLQDRNVTVLNNEAPWKIVYGSPAPIGGALVAMFTSGSRDQYKHLVIVFAAHSSLAIDEIYIEGEPVGPLDASGWCTAGSAFYESLTDPTTTEAITLDGSGNGTVSRSVGSLLWLGTGDSEANTNTQYAATANGTAISAPTAAGLTVLVSYSYLSGNARVNVQKHLSPGGVDTADAYLISQVPDKWTTAHKLSGYAYIVLTLDQNFGKFQGGPPNVTAKGRWKNDVYDFRTATSGYTTNNALCTADFLMHEAGFGATVAEVDSAAAITAANACDSQGYTCDGVISTDGDRDANLQLLEDSMAGFTHFSGGVWRIMAGAWTTPAMTLTDSTTLAGPIEVMQASEEADSRFNSVRGQYVPAGSLGVGTDMTPYQVAAYIAVDPKAAWKDMAFPFTGTNAGCQKLAAIAVERSRLGLKVRYPAHMSCWKLQPGDRVYVNNTEFGFTSKTMVVEDWDFAENQPVGLVLGEDAAAVWTGTSNVPDYQLVSTNLPNPYARPTAPQGLTANSGTGVLQRMTDGTIVTRVQLGWTQTSNRVVLSGGYTQVQWRLASATDDKWENRDLAADATSCFLTGVQDAATILIRVRFVAAPGVAVFGAWNTISHLVVGKTAPPAAPSYVSATQSLVFWAAVTDADLAGYRIRAFPGSSGAVWSRGTALHNDLLTTGPYTLTTKLYGVQTIMVVAEDTTGNQSTAVTAVVDFGTPDLSNAVQTKDYGALAYPGTKSNCSVSGVTLVASAGSSVYSLGDVYSETDVCATTYNAMTWTSEAFAPAYQGGTLTLAQTTSGGSVSIEYQIDGSTTNDAYSLVDDYAAADLYGASSSFATWPGALQVNRMQGVIFRVSIAGGATQGVISAFAPSLVMPDVRQNFGGQAVSTSGGYSISVSGTRLAPSAGSPPRNWIALKSVQATPFVDGNGAVGGRILEFNATSGPLMQLVDGTGTAVNGRASIDIVGLADG